MDEGHVLSWATGTRDVHHQRLIGMPGWTQRGFSEPIQRGAPSVGTQGPARRCTVQTRAIKNARITDSVRAHPRFSAAAKPVTGRPAERSRNAGGQIPTRPAAGGATQTRLAVSKPGDAFEQEADRVADAVMRLSGPE